MWTPTTNVDREWLKLLPAFVLHCKYRETLGSSSTDGWSSLEIGILDEYVQTPESRKQYPDIVFEKAKQSWREVMVKEYVIDNKGSQEEFYDISWRRNPDWTAPPSLQDAYIKMAEEHVNRIGIVDMI